MPFTLHGNFTNLHRTKNKKFKKRDLKIAIFCIINCTIFTLLFKHEYHAMK